MKTSKGAAPPMLECCMCGDHGLSYELFRCDVCEIRSQHRYCSNLYPKAESYRVCNWCLTKTAGGAAGEGTTQNSSPLSSTCNNSSNYELDENNKHGKKKSSGSDGSDNHHHVGLNKIQRGTMQLQLNNVIKKQRSLEQSPRARKKIVAGGCIEETLRRSKSSGEISNSTGITKHVFRGKVRRYKLLDEVSS